VDAAIGRLLAALHKSGRERDTVVIFTSDHGPMGPSERRKPLRGAKADLYEGGLRVPLLMRWPERIARGQVRETLVSGMDLFPTLLAAVGVSDQLPVDGLNLWPVIEDDRRSLGRAELCWHYPHYHHLGIGPGGAIRIGDFKLIEWFEPAVPAARVRDTAAFELFNLATDPGETRNLAGVETDRRDVLLRQLHKWRGAIGAQKMHPNPNYDPSAPTRVLPPASDAIPLKDS